MNRQLSTLHEESLKITLTVPLKAILYLGLMTTVHATTATQKTVDGPSGKVYLLIPPVNKEGWHQGYNARKVISEVCACKHKTDAEA